MPIRAHFKPTPEGEFHPGIPARDLEDEEYRALGAEQRRMVRRSPIYDYVKVTDLDRGDPDQEEVQEEQPDTAPDPPTDPAEDEPAATAEEGETT